MSLTRPIESERFKIVSARFHAESRCCPLCSSLSDLIISVNHPDFKKFNPPLHKGCECTWVFLHSDLPLEQRKPNWVSPKEQFIKEFLGKGDPRKMKKKKKRTLKYYLAIAGGTVFVVGFLLFLLLITLKYG